MTNFEHLIKTKFDDETKIWSGVENPRYFDENASVGKVLFHQMRLNIDKVIQVNDCDGVKLTNREALVLGVRVAQRFQKLGITQDDVIGIVGSFSTNLLPIVLGSFFSAIPFNAMNPNFDKDEFQDMMMLCMPKVIFCDGMIYSHVQSAVNEMKISVDIYTLQDHIPGVAKVDEFFEPTKTEMSFLPSTLKSGGNQIAAIVCSLDANRNETDGVTISNKYLTNFQEGLRAKDVTCTFASINHLQGIYTMIWSLVANATRIITSKPFSAQYMLELIEKYYITKIALTPTEAIQLIQCSEIASRNLSTLKKIILIGNHVPETILNELRNHLKSTKIFIGYSRLELQNVCAVNVKKMKPGSVGSLMPNVQAKILNEAGQRLNVNQPGYIVMDSGFDWNGYYGDFEKTKTIYENGWVHTGDIGYFDEDGDLFIVN